MTKNNSQSSQASSSPNTASPAQPSTQAVPDVQQGATNQPALSVTSPDPLYELAATTPTVESFYYPAINTVSDVLADRVQGATLASVRTQRPLQDSCAQFFGQCWYIAVPVTSTLVTIGYVMHRRYQKDI